MGLNNRDTTKNKKYGVSEKTFVSYMKQGLKMSRMDVIQFRRKGHIQMMLADLIGFVSREVESRILSERAAALNAVFNHFDADHSGEIDKDEFKLLIAYFSGKGTNVTPPTDDEIHDLMNSLDSGGDGMLQREEFVAFSMGGLSQSAKSRREYARQSPMHNKLCVLLDRISLGIDRRTKALHNLFEVMVTNGRSGRKDVIEKNKRFLDASCLYQSIVISFRKNEMVVENKQVKIAAKRFIKALTGDSHSDGLGKNDFVLFQLSGGSNPKTLKKQHPLIDKWRTNLLKSMAW
jgi:Ca2+-binding EF-hand superfamily protein